MIDFRFSFERYKMSCENKGVDSNAVDITTAACI